MGEYYYKQIRAMEQSELEGDEEVQVGDHVIMQIWEEDAESTEQLEFEVTEILPEGYRVTLIGYPDEITLIEYGDEFPDIVHHGHFIRIN